MAEKRNGETPQVPQTNSSRMQQVYRELAEAAESDGCVLITGENGTGKGVLAKLLHKWSPRASGPLVTLDTTLIPKELLESELFGVIQRYLPGVAGKLGLVHTALKTKGAELGAVEVDRSISRIYSLHYGLLSDASGRLACPLPLLQHALSHPRRTSTPTEQPRTTADYLSSELARDIAALPLRPRSAAS